MFLLLSIGIALRFECSDCRVKYKWNQRVVQYKIISFMSNDLVFTCICIWRACDDCEPWHLYKLRYSRMNQLKQHKLLDLHYQYRRHPWSMQMCTMRSKQQEIKQKRLVTGESMINMRGLICDSSNRMCNWPMPTNNKEQCPSRGFARSLCISRLRQWYKSTPKDTMLSSKVNMPEANEYRSSLHHKDLRH